MNRWMIVGLALVAVGASACVYSQGSSEAYGVSSGGAVHVLGSPRDAQIYVDGRYYGYVGMPPIAVGSGVHKVVVKCAGYRTMERQVFVNQSTETIQVDLVPER